MENGVNNISLRDLSTNVKLCISLGGGSFGKCFLKTYKRMGIPVVEKQIIDGNIHEIMYVCMCVYLIGHSPSGLFRTNANNDKLIFK